MWVSAILCEENIEIETENTERIYSKSALFTLKFWAKMIRILAISKNKIENSWSVHLSLALFSLKNWSKKQLAVDILRVKNINIKYEDLRSIYLESVIVFSEFWAKLFRVILGFKINKIKGINT
jgi:hypothetical protein